MTLKLKQHANGNWYVSGTLTVGWGADGAITQEIRNSTRTKDKLQADAIRRLIENQAAEQILTGRKPVLSIREDAAKETTLNQNLSAKRIRWDNCGPTSKALPPSLLDELFEKKSRDRSSVTARLAPPAA
ncbi:hypothetical protein [Rhizobium sp. Root1220]|uniref:hypothetical protein n=1 Tax=Rhizobium sp. Root1220 TaxID=1736432 RepID=UPI0006F52CD1|nr:hypothetical protein [Rhizobium sp. Root1220]KQV68416.1 hypothetical protein ASC90_12460 [Rhizobium sp. Root1220]